ncbi:hypothetical protein TEA_025786 [Camellia sinensis var. sinensis]|uniref:Uncharacterized protein n=1 Tax=Camellia sinensis var. sinensis TaxID=542762 RepID=A0A4S4ERF9_CAMSN|nr:hypothetical protein TEA_025786 [Camellia sinensis var. sinensis]
MASKTLVRTGASLMNRLLNPLLQQQQKNTSSNHLIASSCLEITPMIFPPSLSKFQTSLNFPHNDSDPLKRLSFDGFLYPSGLPSLRFFLPDAMTMSESFSDKHNSMRREEYNNKSSEEIHKFNDILNSEEIGLMRITEAETAAEVGKQTKEVGPPLGGRLAG